MRKKSEPGALVSGYAKTKPGKGAKDNIFQIAKALLDFTQVRGHRGGL